MGFYRTSWMSRLLLTGALVLPVSGVVHAEPTTEPLHILYVRSYNQDSAQGAAFFQLDAVTLCNTDTYRIDFAQNGSKAALATALLAFSSNSPVRVEIMNSTGCTGWGTAIQSIYIVK
jgi:hypothetical protein